MTTTNEVIELEKEIYLTLIDRVDKVVGTQEEKLLFLSQLRNSLKRNIKELLKKI